MSCAVACAHDHRRHHSRREPLVGSTAPLGESLMGIKQQTEEFLSFGRARQVYGKGGTTARLIAHVNMSAVCAHDRLREREAETHSGRGARARRRSAIEALE